MDDALINCIMCKNATPTSFLRKHLAFHHMASGEDIVERLVRMHFPVKEVECQTPVSWSSQFTDTEDMERENESNFEPKEVWTNLADFQNDTEFAFGIIVNETEMEETKKADVPRNDKPTRKLRGPKCVRRRRDSYESEEDPDYNAVDMLLEETNLLLFIHCHGIKTFAKIIKSIRFTNE